MIKKTDRPVYCRGCKSSDTFDPAPERDICFESGRVFFHRFRCYVCGNEALWPGEESFVSSNGQKPAVKSASPISDEPIEGLEAGGGTSTTTVETGE